MLVKDNLLVIRIDVGYLTQWGTSWPRERVCGRVGFERIVEICGKSAMFREARMMEHPPASEK
jgi:hypothetical protein